MSIKLRQIASIQRLENVLREDPTTLGLEQWRWTQGDFKPLKIGLASACRKATY